VITLYEVEAKAKVRSFKEAYDYLNNIADYAREFTYYDIYLDHPCKDFSKTDEELRIREITYNEERFLKLTYKSKALYEDRTVREEIEIDISSLLVRILEKLGFKKSLWKKKKGWMFKIKSLEVALVSVSGGVNEREVFLGDYVEVEKVVVSESDINYAREEVLNFLKQIPSTGEIEYRYYTELLEELLNV